MVTFDRERLGDISGLRTVHLQCHIGTDTLSLHRLEARVSGLDVSPVSIDRACRLAEAAGADIDYVVSDVPLGPDRGGAARARRAAVPAGEAPDRLGLRRPAGRTG